jgi:DNA replication licensing factor MCM3
MSVASSYPASQLLASQTQSQTQSANSATAAPAVSKERLLVFRKAMGQLLGDESLFMHEAAEIPELIRRLNEKVRVRGEGEFRNEEADLCFEEMVERNEIM